MSQAEAEATWAAEARDVGYAQGAPLVTPDLNRTNGTHGTNRYFYTTHNEKGLAGGPALFKSADVRKPAGSRP